MNNDDERDHAEESANAQLMRDEQCPEDWGSGYMSQHCILEAGHDQPHRDSMDRTWGIGVVRVETVPEVTTRECACDRLDAPHHVVFVWGKNRNGAPLSTMHYATDDEARATMHDLQRMVTESLVAFS